MTTIKLSSILRFLTIAFLCGITITGCALFRGQMPPGWIEGESPTYPSEKFLVGVGEGDSRMVAEKRAYAAVARIFEARVEAQAKDSETYSIKERQGISQTSRQLTLDHVTQVSTKKVLANVRVLDRWDQPQKGQFFVLAGLDRIQSERSLLEEISQMDQIVNKEVTASRAADDTLTKIRRLKRAIHTLALRDSANTDLRIIRASGQGQMPPYQLAELKIELDQHLSNDFTIQLRIQGEQAPIIRRALLEGLSREGFLSVQSAQNSRFFNGTQNSQSAQSADLLIRGAGTIWTVDVPDPLFVYVRWCSDLLVVDDQPQRIIGVVSRSGREGHITQREAFARASKAMQTAVTTDVANALSDYIYGEVEDLPPPENTACPR